MERCMQEIGTVHKQGFLTKSPPVTQLNSIRSWKRKFFVILQINPEKGNIFRTASKRKDLDKEVIRVRISIRVVIDAFFV